MDRSTVDGADHARLDDRYRAAEVSPDDPLTLEAIMNGIHDMGGMHGFGKIQYLPEEPPFREEWEGRMFALHATVTGVGLMNIDEWRHGQERMNPAEYLSVSYY
jgi:hypothetical protein